MDLVKISEGYCYRVYMEKGRITVRDMWPTTIAGLQALRVYKYCGRTTLADLQILCSTTLAVLHVLRVESDRAKISNVCGRPKFEVIVLKAATQTFPSFIF